METSYFGNLRNIAVPLSISGRAPEWYVGPQFKTLAPKYEFYRAYKAGEIDSDGYTAEFKRLVLAPLDAREVFDHLTQSHGDNVTILCYEKPGDFCHRRLVADWFHTELGLVVPEWTKPKTVPAPGTTLWN